MDTNGQLTEDPKVKYVAKQGRGHFLIDEPNNRIDYLDNRFYRAPSGAMVPSVTTLLEAWPKGPAYYEWLKRNGENSDRIMEDAGDRGSTVHELTELLDRGGEVSAAGENGPRYRMSEWSMLERYVEFRQRHTPAITEIETQLISEELGYAGTLDRVLELNGERWIIDLKTSNAIYDHFHLQTAAYLSLYAHLGNIDAAKAVGIRRGILHLNAKTRTYGKGDAIQGPGWQLIESPNSFEEDLDLFGACCKMWHAINRDVKPRNLSYSLTHHIPTT